jgi:hypothetical protein
VPGSATAILTDQPTISRGPGVGRDSRTISERKITETVIAALREKLMNPALIVEFVAEFKRAFEVRSKVPQSDSIISARRRFGSVAARLKNEIQKSKEGR